MGMKARKPGRPIPEANNARRIALGLSQRAVAKKAGVSQSVVSDYERGKHVPEGALLAIKKVLWGKVFPIVVARAQVLNALRDYETAVRADERERIRAKLEAGEAS